MELYGIRIPTVLKENTSIRCDGCRGVIEGTPWRVNVLDIVPTEVPVSWTENGLLNPGPFQFHAEPSHVRAWMAERGYLFCRKSEVREIMRPIPVPGPSSRWGLCDGIHRDDHELVPA